MPWSSALFPEVRARGRSLSASPVGKLLWPCDVFKVINGLQVRNREARKGGLDVSLFRQLSDAHPHAVVELTQQYRMNADIMLLSNKLIYDDRLICGNQKVANQSLILPDDTFTHRIHTPNSPCRDSCWLIELTLPR
jgi:DNA replication ATP-dependent helicase Dna2